MKISGFLGLTAFLMKYIFAWFVSLDESCFYFYCCCSRLLKN